MKKFNPYPHQEAGIQWILDRPACALIWGMGSGKTATTLTAADRLLYDYLEDGPVLVIAPLRVALDTWSTECSEWEHLNHLRISKIIGTQKQRIKALEAPADIYIINRENTHWLVDYCTSGGRDWPFPIVVLDELSSFKNQQTKRWRALRRVRGRIKRIIGLTGTPRPRGLEDLWPEMYLLDQGARLGKTLGAFRDCYLLPDKRNGHQVYSWKPRDGAEEEVYGRISDICMSVRKQDVIKLPGQEYQDVKIELTPALKKQYRQFERDCVLEFVDENGEIIAGNSAALVNKLLQYSNGAIYDTEKKVHHIHDIKLDALEELVEEAGGDNVLIMYAFQHDADRIKERIPTCRLLDTSQDIQDWKAGKIPIAIAHPASIGHGLNLQSGGHIIIWFGLPWSLELYQQANERLNRPGQTHVCQIYHLMTRDTRDEQVLRVLQTRDEGQAGAIDALLLDILKGE